LGTNIAQQHNRWSTAVLIDGRGPSITPFSFRFNV
jgi:hypothetical protein